MADWSPEQFVDRRPGRRPARAARSWSARTSASASGPPETSRTLAELGAAHGFAAEGVALDGGPQVWSSTYIRNCLAAGDVEGAAEALGHPFAVRGVVVKGDQRGRELGYPTANVPTRGMLAAPADGVYAGWLRRLDQPDDALLPAAISVGTNPTFAGERERRVEAYVLDRDDLELYGVEVEVSFVGRLRGMAALRLRRRPGRADGRRRRGTREPSSAPLMVDRRADPPRRGAVVRAPRAALLRARPSAPTSARRCRRAGSLPAARWSPLLAALAVGVLVACWSGGRRPAGLAAALVAAVVVLALYAVTALRAAADRRAGRSGRTLRQPAACCSRWSPGRCRCCCCS